METFTANLQTLYADHHVTEVRRLLLELSGVKDVYASSSFQAVEVTFDEKELTPAEITGKLDEAGYLGELPVPVERGAISELKNGDKPYFRQSVAYEPVDKVVDTPLPGFAQKVPFVGRPLWPCPGMGPLPMKSETDEPVSQEEEITHG